jgi:hypothetical protein
MPRISQLPGTSQMPRVPEPRTPYDEDISTRLTGPHV